MNPAEKIKNIQFSMVINGFILDNLDIKIIQGIKMRKDDFHSKREIINGRILPCILLRGYRGTYFGKNRTPKVVSKSVFHFFFGPKTHFRHEFSLFSSKKSTLFFYKKIRYFFRPPPRFFDFSAFFGFFGKIGAFRKFKGF